MTKPLGSGSATIADAGQDDRAVAVAFQDALYDNLLISQLSSLLVAVGFGVFFQGHTEPQNLYAWLGYMVVVGGFRFWSRWHYRAAAQPRNLRYWDRIFLVGVVMAASGWGMAGLAFFDPSHVQQQILLTGAVAGVSAGALPHLSPSPRAANTFLLLCLLPLAYAYLSHPAIGPGLGLLTLLYLATMLFVARRTHNSLRNNILLLHGNQRLVGQLTERTEALEAAKAQDEAERELALSVFRAILPASALAADNLTYHLSSHSAFNGDLLLIETRPDGRQNLMLGDFTGHGLAASLGAIPAADIFVAMTRKGFPINLIANEINRKLHNHLPRNLFCAACLAEVDAAHSRVRVWNGGLPSVYLLCGEQGGIRQRIGAMHLPLGILPPAEFNASVHTLRITRGDQIFMATDGVIEQCNAAGEMFGEQRLERILDGVADVKDLAYALKAELARFGKGADQGDDITFVALRAAFDEAPHAVGTDDGQVDDATDALLREPDWSLALTLRPGALRRVDPVPVLNQLVREINGNSDDAIPMELVLGELFKNGLDHGVLGLDSEQKQLPDGFDAYYRARDASLAALASGSVTVDITSHPTADGGLLELLVSDTGPGFDHQRLQQQDVSQDQTHGRGLRLVRSFCRSLEYLGRGNRVRALLRWRSAD